MAKYCSPFAPADNNFTSNFITKADKEDPTGWLGDFYKMADYVNEFVKKREGYDKAFFRTAIADLRAMAPMKPQDILDFAVRKEWIRLDEDGVYKSGRQAMNETTRGYAAAVMKVAVEGMAGAVKNQADSFLMKLDADQNTWVVEGLELAKSMQAMSKVGEVILGYGQKAGQEVRNFGLAKGVNFSQEAIETGAADALGNPGEFADKFKEIASLLNSGDEALRLGAKKELTSLAKRVQFMQYPHEISKATLGMSIAGNAWTELMINGLLSSPTTFVTNMLGAIWVPTRALVTLGAAQAYAMTGLKGARTAEQVAAEATASLGAMYAAFNDGLKMGWHAARTETAAYQNPIKGIAGENLAGPYKAATGKDLYNENRGLYDTIDRVGKYVRLPSRALLGTDEFARHLAIRGEVAARGVRRAAKNGVDMTDKKALGDFIQKEAEMAFDLPKAELWEKYRVDSNYDLNSGIQSGSGKSVSAISAEAVFQEKNKVAGAINKLVEMSGPFGPVIRPFIPFVRTPLNIISQGVLDSTGVRAVYKGVGIAATNPTNAVLAIQQELLKDPNETFRIAGQIALATTLGGTIYGMAMDGRITGGGPERWTKGREAKTAQQAWLAAGNVPYSFDIGGGNRVSFDRFGEPLSILMRMYADFGMHSAYMSQTEQDEVQMGFVSIAASGLYQASFLTGVDRLVRTIQDFEYSGARAVQSWWAAQTPFGGLLAFVERTVDPYKSAYEGSTFDDIMRVHEDAFGTGMFGQMASRLPGLGKAPQLIDQLTANPVPIVPGVGSTGLNPLQMAIPIFPRNMPADDVWQAVFDIQGSYSEMRPLDAGKVTQPEQQRFNRLMGTSTIRGKTLAQRILEFRRRPDVQRFVEQKGSALSGTKTALQKEFTKILSEYKSVATKKLLATDPTYNERARKKASLDVFKEQDDIESARSVENELEELYQRARRGF